MQLQNDVATKKSAIKKLSDEFESTLNREQSYLDAAAQVKAIEKAITSIAYRNAEHEKVRLLCRTIEEAIAAQATFKQELGKQKQRAAEVTALCHALRQKKEEETAISAHMKNASMALQTDELAVTSESKQLMQNEQEVKASKELLMREQGALATEKRNFEQIRTQQEQTKKEVATLAEEIDDYSAIAAATGKDGIQALLIEEAIPEVEYEANELLGKLTDNQTQLFIESLRDLKKGGTKETLDIKISDPAGIRPYELFSGGEAFRIDLALRIAISKLLARRAGTALQTLIVDEGFGSQDEEGLSRIMEAIHKIQDEFAKVIIVSHLDALKEQFPVHFVVTKSAGCSNVTVIENG